MPLAVCVPPVIQTRIIRRVILRNENVLEIDSFPHHALSQHAGLEAGNLSRDQRGVAAIL